jgi:hypothetical protein
VVSSQSFPFKAQWELRVQQKPTVHFVFMGFVTVISLNSINKLICMMMVKRF